MPGYIDESSMRELTIDLKPLAKIAVEVCARRLPDHLSVDLIIDAWKEHIRRENMKKARVMEDLAKQLGHHGEQP